MKINLSRALKEKNRLIKKIKKLQDFIYTNNTYEEVGENDSNKICILNEISELEASTQKLVFLKSEIAKANANSGISKLVYEMEELKSLASYYKRFSTKSNLTSCRYDLDGDYVAVKNKSQIDYETALKMVDSCEEKIETLQDQIDDLNSTTFIEF